MLLNTQIWKTVIETAKAKVATQPAWLRAIDRAVTEIEKARYWSFADGVLTIESTTSRRIYKIAEAHSCEAIAKGYKACKHIAARRLMLRYHEALAKADAQAAAVQPTAPRTLKNYPAGLISTPQGESYYGISI